MGNILIVAIVFIGFSMSMSWVVGHKERSDLSDQLEATEVTKRDIQEKLAKVGKDLKEESSKIKELTEALQREKEERAKAEEALIQREALLKAAKEDAEQAGEEDRGGVTSEEEQLKREEEARQEAENILLQTELDRVMAEESLLKKAEELVIVKAELALLESLGGRYKLGSAKIRRMVDEGEGGQAARLRVQAEEALEAQITAKRQREALLTGEVKDAALVKEEIEYRLEQARLLKLESTGKISAEELDAALDRASLKHVNPFSVEDIFEDAPSEDEESGQEWWRRANESYRVTRADESLSVIAAKDSVYGNANLWPVLYIYNLDQTENPDFMDPGQLLVIPHIISGGEVREKIHDYYREDSVQGIESNDEAPDESVPMRQSET